MLLDEGPAKRNVQNEKSTVGKVQIHGIVILDFTFIHTAAILSTSLVVILGVNEDIHRRVLANRLGV